MHEVYMDVNMYQIKQRCLVEQKESILEKIIDVLFAPIQIKSEYHYHSNVDILRNLNNISGK